MPKPWKLLLTLLLLSNLLVLGAIFGQDNNLHMVFCNVGQGDATLIYKGSTQILVDGGPDSSVISCLSNHMPFWDRTIELVVLTHPEQDHFGGLIDVFRRYKITTFSGSGLSNKSEGYKTLEKETDTETDTGMNVISLTSGDRVKKGEIILDVLSPQKEVVAQRSAPTSRGKILSATESVNEYSVVLEMSYAAFKSLLTGDIEPPVTNQISQIKQISPIDVLKVPHHGSKNGLTQELLDAVRPSLAVISAGKNNRYGHPHASVLDMLSKGGAKVLRTDVDGEVEVVSDGNSWRVK
ncbi:MAG: MBL fold metallo-hydrolase [Candidatus Blackburnbacteria bacterium]|nr:MBL fold metallo-hydrolase [Candidatus Blackburnbacteria bacterium]